MPRWIHRLYAQCFGYFWKPCRLCGAMHGGHEIRDGDYYLHDDDGDIGHAVCQAAECQEIARRSQEAWERRRYGGVFVRVAGRPR